MNIVTKDFPVIGGDATDEHPHGTFEVVLSAPTLDRDGEIVDSRAFEPLPDHISFDTDHSMTCDSVVGSGIPSYAEDGTLRVKGGYSSDERSQTIRRKVAEGHIRTTSVTFMAATREPDEKGVTHITKGELLNGTFTPIPSNRESVVLAAKSLVLKDGRRNSGTDMKMIQTAHDAMVALGADCVDCSGTGDDPAAQKETSDLQTKQVEDETSEAVPAEETEPGESTAPADEAAAAAESAVAADEVPEEVKTALAVRRAQLNAALL